MTVVWNYQLPPPLCNEYNSSNLGRPLCAGNSMNRNCFHLRWLSGSTAWMELEQAAGAEYPDAPSPSILRYVPAGCCCCASKVVSQRKAEATVEMTYIVIVREGAMGCSAGWPWR